MVKIKHIELKRIVWILVVSIILSVFISSATVFAEDRIESIHLEAEIQKNGSVLIRDHRIFYAETGTEHFISLGNLGASELRAYVVYDENNQALDYVDQWDINASFAEKAGKYGINYTDQAVELCFGLGEYGRREFTIEYEITNFISNLTDEHQSFYWQFINQGMDPIDDIEISVKNDVSLEFAYPESRFWGFGHEGGKIEITSEALIFNSGDNFEQSDYVVLLGIFEGAPFSTDQRMDRSSDELIALAMEGASFEEEEDDEDSGVSGILAFLRFPLILLLLVTGLTYNSVKRRKKQEFKPSTEDAYYREVPYDRHFINTQYFANSEVSNWISAFILKWISAGWLVGETEEVGLIVKRDKLALKIMPNDWQHDNAFERRLWDMVLEAAGEDRILSEKEFNRYVRKNIESFNTWVDSVEKESETIMVQEGYLEETVEKVLKFFTRRELAITPKGQELGDNIVGFEHYLKDFSLLEERGVSHVVLWQELMIWAAYMGIAEEVYEQLKNVNPQVVSELPYSTQTIIMTNYFAHAVQSTLSSANASSSFSGGGGSSFGGGGGGASGGGFGGGNR